MDSSAHLFVLDRIELIAARLRGKPRDDDLAHGWDRWKWNQAGQMVAEWERRIVAAGELRRSHYGWTVRALFDLDVDTEHGVARDMVALDNDIAALVEGSSEQEEPEEWPANE